MVIRFENLMKTITEVDSKKIEDLENKIDEALIRTFNGRDSVTINLRNLDLPRACSYEKLVQDYKNAGWDIKHVLDQRDSNYLQITPHK